MQMVPPKFLSRRGFLCTAAAVTTVSCSNPGEKTELLPMDIGEWHRMAVENIPAEEHPSELKERGIKRTRRGIYQGASKITVSVYEFGAGAVAFEMVQKWRPQPQKMAMHAGPDFVILESTDADAKQMSAFATLIEASLKK
ncbi:MAG: hypothetical protein HY820_14405 [Acidobacteria bacterium]|nr:hypothetical protein [Acidobacteriota bacterium]